MRALFLAPVSALLLSACLTTQENPNYEHSTVYRGDSASTTQYASAPSVDISNATYDSTTGQYVFTDQATTSAASYEPAPATYQQAASYQQPTYEAAPVFAHPAPAIPGTVSGTASEVAPVYSASTGSIYTGSTSVVSAPTDEAYNSQEVTGTPGFMALQSQQQPVVEAQLAPPLPAAEEVGYAQLRAAGTPVPYDYSRNIIAADAVTTGQQLPDTVTVLQGASQNYIVQPGDTVYSLSRRTCVGVNVIQSLNGLGSDYGINIGQSIRLPASVC